jgi:cell division protein FtsA
MFAVIRKRIEDTGLLEQLSAGAILTGGAVLLEGMPEFAEEILGMPVRLGFPTGVRGLTQLVQGPQYATAVGLVKYGATQIVEAHNRAPSPPVSLTRQKVIKKAPVAAVEEAEVDAKPAQGSKIWEWLKAAF